MLLLLFGLIAYLFMLLGAAAFLVCIAITPVRRYALSAALWFAICGPCSILLLTLAGLTLVAGAFISNNGSPHLIHYPHLLSVFGWTYLSIGILITAVVASAAAWLHQFLMHRFTFALFRLYAVAVVSGIGSVFGWGLSWWLMLHGIAYAWAWSLLSMLLLIAGFGFAAYRSAHSLRGQAPKRFTWVTEEEFNRPAA